MTDDTLTDAAADSCLAPGRRAAGEDPAKREQIIEGAKRVFLRLGFDAASMNDITREAGVSKGTIYVYFQNKEDLFAAMIEQERSRVVENIKLALNPNAPVDEALFDFAMRLATHITSDNTIRAMRIVVGVSDRMPTLAQRFFVAPENGCTLLKAYLERHIELGTFKIEDTEIAARQFIEMSMVGMLKRRLFGEMQKPPERDYIAKVVTSGIKVFRAAYATQAATPV